MRKVSDIDIEVTINSGQVFLWNKIGDKWVGVDGQDVIILSQSPFDTRSSGDIENFFTEDYNLKKYYQTLVGIAL